MFQEISEKNSFHTRLLNEKRHHNFHIFPFTFMFKRFSFLKPQFKTYEIIYIFLKLKHIFPTYTLEKT